MTIGKENNAPDIKSTATKAETAGEIDWMKLRQTVAEGLLYTHSRLNGNTTKALEVSSFLYALIELLEDKGLINIDELDERKHEMAAKLGKKYCQEGMGVILQDPQPDKYLFEGIVEIDCDNRVDLCKAACCRLPFALSKQDLYEGMIRWNLGEPYLIEHSEDGYCCHLNQDSCACRVHKYRPLPCRAFDCRHDKRIWLNFKERVPNPLVNRPDWLQCVAESIQEQKKQ